MSEFNVFDGNAVMRGHMAAASGTFSGTFSAGNVDAVDNININDGSVSSYYTFSQAAGTDITVVVPAQPENYQLILHVPMEIFNLPLSFYNASDSTGWHNNGVQAAHQVVFRIDHTVGGTTTTLYNQVPSSFFGRNLDFKVVNTGVWHYDWFQNHHRKTATLIYEAIDTSVANTFRFRRGTRTGDGELIMLDSIVAEFRKR